MIPFQIFVRKIHVSCQKIREIRNIIIKNMHILVTAEKRIQYDGSRFLEPIQIFQFHHGEVFLQCIAEITCKNRTVSQSFLKEKLIV